MTKIRTALAKFFQYLADAVKPRNGGPGEE